MFVLGSDTQSNTDSEGRVAVGGDAVFANYGIGSALNPSTTRADLVVGGTLSVEGGENFHGNTVVASRQNVLQYTMTNGNGVPGQPLEGTPIDFAAEGAYLRCASLAWASLAPNGTAAVSSGGLTLTGTDPSLNIFQINAADVAGSGTAMAALNGINIVSPAGSTTLVNVTGTSAGFGSYSIFRNGTAATGADGQSILWNLARVTSLAANTTSIKGSVLAPRATYVAGYSNIEGTLVVDTLVGNVEAHHYPFTGTLPDTGCAGTTPAGPGEPETPGNPGPSEGPDCPYRQAISDIVESVALEQTALSHILNAEGEKIQKVVAAEDGDVATLLAVNRSVQRTVEAVGRLEILLLSKLETAEGFCDPR